MSLGRYFPLYRLFYAIPFASRMRAPLKFLHLTEIAVAFLFAFGMAEFLGQLKSRPATASVKQKDRGPVRVLFRFAVGCGLCSALFFCLALLSDVFLPSLRSYWQELGLADHAPVMHGRVQLALTHAGVLFLLGAGVFVAASRCRSARWLVPGMAAVVLIVVSIDLAVGNRQYIRVRDLSIYYAPNAVADCILHDSEMGRLAYYLTVRDRRSPLWMNFRLKGVELLEPQSGQRLPDAYRQFFGAFGQNMPRLWQVSNTRFIVME